MTRVVVVYPPPPEFCQPISRPRPAGLEEHPHTSGGPPQSRMATNWANRLLALRQPLVERKQQLYNHPWANLKPIPYCQEPFHGPNP